MKIEGKGEEKGRGRVLYYFALDLLLDLKYILSFSLKMLRQIYEEFK